MTPSLSSTLLSWLSRQASYLGSRMGIPAQPAFCNLLIIIYIYLNAESVGGALSRGGGAACKTDLVKVPPPSMGVEMAQLLASGTGADCTFLVEDEEFKVGFTGPAFISQSCDIVMGYHARTQ